MPLSTTSSGSIVGDSNKKVMKLWWEHATSSLENLPAELQRNFSLMRDLDSKSQSTMQEIDGLGNDILKHGSNMSPERKKEMQTKISKLFTKSKALGDDKVQLAIQTYELVDKHIRRLDSDLARFETEIKNGGSGTGVIGIIAATAAGTSGNRTSGASSAKAGDSSLNSSAGTGDGESEGGTNSGKRKRGRKREKESSIPPINSTTIAAPGAASTASGSGRKQTKAEALAAAELSAASGSESPARKKHRSGMGPASAGASAAGTSSNTTTSEIQLAAVAAAGGLPSNADAAMDMPVDPNEPTYCICQQVSYGEMIACDNPDCPIEWFHMTCMGINVSPKGKWFCPKCTPNKKK